MALLPLAALPAAAASITPEIASKGVAFSRADGSKGRLVVQGDQVTLNYITNRGEMTDDRVARFGVFETHRLYRDSEYPVVGSGPPVWDWFFAKTPPRPTSGKSVTVGIRGAFDQVGYGDFMVELHNRQQNRVTATYAFLPEVEVSLSKCRYRALPVEMTYKGQTAPAQRWVYFPDLRYGIETVRGGKANAIAAMTPG